MRSDLSFYCVTVLALPRNRRVGGVQHSSLLFIFYFSTAGSPSIGLIRATKVIRLASHNFVITATDAADTIAGQLSTTTLTRPTHASGRSASLLQNVALWLFPAKRKPGSPKPSSKNGVPKAQLLLSRGRRPKGVVVVAATLGACASEATTTLLVALCFPMASINSSSPVSGDDLSTQIFRPTATMRRRSNLCAPKSSRAWQTIFSTLSLPASSCPK